MFNAIKNNKKALERIEDFLEEIKEKEEKYYELAMVEKTAAKKQYYGDKYLQVSKERLNMERIKWILQGIY